LISARFRKLFWVIPILKKNSTKLLQDLAACLLAAADGPASMEAAAEMIRTERHYRWVGVYKITRTECVIVAGTGNEPPTYARFPKTQGLCGAVAESCETLIVGDVKKDPRYLPTFWSTCSEIVVPIISETTKRVVGLIDAESDKLDAFTEDDRDFLEHVAVLLARTLCSAKKHHAPAR
jgi:L-methionine (R)-S-oxide reductase